MVRVGLYLMDITRKIAILKFMIKTKFGSPVDVVINYTKKDRQGWGSSSPNNRTVKLPSFSWCLEFFATDIPEAIANQRGDRKSQRQS